MGEVLGELRSATQRNSTTLTDVLVRLAVVERLMITPRKLAVILSIASGVGSVVFGGVVAVATIIRH